MQLQVFENGDVVNAVTDVMMAGTRATGISIWDPDGDVHYGGPPRWRALSGLQWTDLENSDTNKLKNMSLYACDRRRPDVMYDL